MPMARLRSYEEIRSAVPERAETRETRQGSAHSQIARPYNTTLREKQVGKIAFWYPLYTFIDNLNIRISNVIAPLAGIICLRRDRRCYRLWKQVR